MIVVGWTRKKCPCFTLVVGELSQIFIDYHVGWSNRAAEDLLLVRATDSVDGSAPSIHSRTHCLINASPE